MPALHWWRVVLELWTCNYMQLCAPIHRMSLQGALSVKLCGFKDGNMFVRSCDLLRPVLISVQADQSTRVQSTGSSSSLQTRHVGQIALDTELAISLTPAALLELGGLHTHALACAVRLYPC